MRVADSEPGLIGRVDELGAVRDRLSGPIGEVVLLAGPAGIGKTRLVDEALRDSEAAAFVGRTSPASTGRPFELLLSVVEPVVRHWSAIPPGLSGVADVLGHLIHPIAPQLAVSTVDGSIAVGDQVHAVIALMRHLDVELLVAEDLHWADIESLHTIDRLMAAPDPPTFVGTYRPGVAEDPRALGELIGALERRHGALHVHLEPFAADEVREFVRATVRDDPDERTLERLVHQTAGNPFLLQQLLSCGIAAVQPFSTPEMPWTLASSLRRELDGLDAADADALAAAAVLGTEFDFELLQHATGLDEASLIARLRSLRDRQLIEEVDVDEFRFRHDLLREALVDGLLGRELRRWHDAAFRARSVRTPDDYAELARHARGAGRIDDLVALAPDGVRHYLASGSTRRALKLAQSALDVRSDHLELLELATRAAWLSGQLDEATRLGERWGHVLRGGSDDESCTDDLEAITLLARIAYEQGATDRRAELLDELEGWLRCADDMRQTAQVHAALAQHAMLDGRNDEAVSHADRAIELAEPIEAVDIVRRARVERASALLHEGGYVTSRAELEEVALEAERVGDHHTAARAWFNTPPSNDLEVDSTVLMRMRAAAVRVGAEEMATSAYAHRRLDLAIRAADLQAAREWASQARLLGSGSVKTAKLANAEAALAVEAGELDLGRELGASIEHGSHHHGTLLSGLVHARLSIADGDVEAALGQLTRNADDCHFAPLTVLVARELADAGAPSDELAALRSAMDDRPNPTAARAADAVLAIYAGEPDAVDLLDAVVGRRFCWDRDETLAEPADRLLAAEVRIAAARGHLARGDRDQAIVHAGAARDLLVDWPGSRRDEAMRILGCAADDQQTTESPLTGREIDVARLLARGMTNGEIADELFIARKTVSTHVSNILMKLGMRSRTEVATWAVHTGVAA